MQVVIDIDDEMYEQIVTNDDVYVLDDVDYILIENAIANGTPLPKGHGRLIDADALKGELDTITEWNGDVHRYVTEKGIDYAPTIIKADAPDINVGNIESEE